MKRFLWLAVVAACVPPAEAPAPTGHDRCRGGEVAACRNLAEAYLGGQRPAFAVGMDRRAKVCGVAEPEEPAACMAAVLYAHACDVGDGASCAAVGDLVADGRIEGTERAAAHYARACARGHASGCARSGAAQLAGGDPGAAETLQRGCAGGAGAACYILGRAHATGQLKLDQAEARQLFLQGCEHGDGRACAAAAEREVQGLGGAVKRRAATEHYRRACTAGVASACVTLGRYIEHGEVGLASDPAAAFDFYRKARAFETKACDEGDAGACGRLGVLLREGSGGPSATERGRRLQVEACTRGDAPSCRWAAMGPRGDFEPARVSVGAKAALRAACRADGDACVFLAVLGEEDALAQSCERGHGPSCTAFGLAPVDPQKLRRACDLGDANGCYHLGLVMAQPSVDQDLEAAVDLYREACRWGSGAACTQVGISLLRGEGLRLDPMAATSAFVQACRLGDPAGCAELGWLRLSGHGKTDIEEGVSRLRGACRRGRGEACARLGLVRLRGQYGLERDPAAGKTLLREACNRGSERGCLDLAEALGQKRELVERAAERGRRRCEQALLRCGDVEAWTTTWRVTRDEAQRRVSPPPRCGGELERLCNDAREATAAHCAAEASACWPAARFTRRLTNLGASVTTAVEQEQKAVKWALRACAKGEAAACAVMGQAHRAGRAARQDDAAADRFVAKACRADPGYCP